MSKVILQNIQPVEELHLDEGTYILLLHANKVPPHLGLIVDAKYYSLTANEAQVELSVKPIWRMIQSKGIGTLFIQVNSVGSLDLLNEVFAQYSQAIAGKVSCLQPLKTYFEKHHQLKVDDVNFVFDLVNRLDQYDMLGATYHMNLEEELSKNSFELKEYTMDDIYARIQEIQKETINFHFSILLEM